MSAVPSQRQSRDARAALETCPGTRRATAQGHAKAAGNAVGQSPRKASKGRGRPPARLASGLLGCIRRRGDEVRLVLRIDRSSAFIRGYHWCLDVRPIGPAYFYLYNLDGTNAHAIRFPVPVFWNFEPDGAAIKSRIRLWVMFLIVDNYRVDTIQHLFAQPVTIRTADIVNDTVRRAAPRRVRCPPLVRDAIFKDRLFMRLTAFVGHLDHEGPRRLKGGHPGERFISRSHRVTCIFNLLIVA